MPTEVEGLSTEGKGVITRPERAQGVPGIGEPRRGCGTDHGGADSCPINGQCVVEALLHKGLITVEKTKGQPKSPQPTFMPAEPLQ